MKINKNINILLTSEDVKEIIVEYLNNNGYKNYNKSVDFNLEDICTGYGRSESHETVFAGCIINCKEE